MNILTDEFTVRLLSLADQIIILDERGSIAEQGSWEEIRFKSGYISQLVLDEKHGRLKNDD